MKATEITNSLKVKLNLSRNDQIIPALEARIVYLEKELERLQCKSHN